MLFYQLSAILGLDDWIFWLVLLVALVVIEMSTVMLVTIWFAGGALAAMLAALAGLSIPWQIGIFILVSIVLFAVGWQFRDRLNVGRNRRTPTNADRLIGRTALVTLPLDRLHASGQVTVNGQEWSAAANSDRVIPAGTRVTVVAIEGVKLIVEPQMTES